MTRLLILVQMGVCRRYALEAIINVIVYLHVHNYVYVSCYNCNVSRVYNNHVARRKTHMYVWNNKRKNVFLFWLLRLTQVLHDGSIFLIMGMTMCNTPKNLIWIFQQILYLIFWEGYLKFSSLKRRPFQKKTFVDNSFGFPSQIWF